MSENEDDDDLTKKIEELEKRLSSSIVKKNIIEGSSLYFQRALTYKRKRKWEDSLCDFSKALSMNSKLSKEPRTHYYVARVLYAQKKFEKSFESITKCIELFQKKTGGIFSFSKVKWIFTKNPDKTHKYFYLRAQCHLTFSNYSLAIDDLRKCCKINPKYTQAYYDLSRYHFGVEYDVAQANEMCEMALCLVKNEKQKLVVLCHKAVLLLELKRQYIEKGRELLESLVKKHKDQTKELLLAQLHYNGCYEKYHESIANIVALIKIAESKKGPTCTFHAQMAHYYVQIGDQEKARECIVRSNVGFEECNRFEKCKTLKNRMNYYLQLVKMGMEPEKNSKRAKTEIHHVRKLLQRGEPTINVNYVVDSMYARYYYVVSKYQKCVVRIRNVLKSVPKKSSALILLGSCLLFLGDLEGSEKFVRIAVKISKFSDTYHCSLGRALFDRRCYRASIKHFESAIAFSIKPSGRLYYFLGQSTNKLKLEDEIMAELSIKSFNAAIETFEETENKTIWDYNMCGNSFQLLKKHEKAVECYTKSIEIQDQYPISRYNRGLSYYSCGDIDLSLNDIMVAVQFANWKSLKGKMSLLMNLMNDEIEKKCLLEDEELFSKYHSIMMESTEGKFSIQVKGDNVSVNFFVCFLAEIPYFDKLLSQNVTNVSLVNDGVKETTLMFFKEYVYGKTLEIIVERFDENDFDELIKLTEMFQMKKEQNDLEKMRDLKFPFSSTFSSPSDLEKEKIDKFRYRDLFPSMFIAQKDGIFNNFEVRGKEGKTIRVCKKIVSARSEFLFGLFNSQFQDSNTKFIEIECNFDENLDLIVEYLYVCPIDYGEMVSKMSAKQVCELLEISNKYLLRGLERKVKVEVIRSKIGDK